MGDVISSDKILPRLVSGRGGGASRPLQKWNSRGPLNLGKMVHSRHEAWPAPLSICWVTHNVFPPGPKLCLCPPCHSVPSTKYRTWSRAGVHGFTVPCPVWPASAPSRVLPPQSSGCTVLRACLPVCHLLGSSEARLGQPHGPSTSHAARPTNVMAR